MAHRRLFCYIEGRGDEWEAICLDFDIAVHGGSLYEVKSLLVEAVNTYFEDVAKEAPAVRATLLNRRVPLHVRIGIVAALLWHMLRGGNESGPDFEARFEIPCPA